LIWKIVAAILAVAFIINYTHNEIIRQSREEARDARLVEWYKDERNKAGASDGIDLKIFTDYLCPACSQLVPRYLETTLAAEYGIVQVRSLDYPLDAACNDSSTSTIHPALRVLRPLQCDWWTKRCRMKVMV
jgi:hypothetical protein